MTMTTMTQEDFLEEARRRFGDNKLEWRFVCPSCGHIASVKEWLQAGASEGEVAFSCIGRHIPGSRKAFGELGAGPCDYAGGGLFALNPLRVTSEDGRECRFFAFAQEP